MFSNKNRVQIAANVDQEPSEHRHTFSSSSSPIYPASGAFQHLPARRTLSGALATAHPNANKIFLRDLPGHCYVLPNVPLNFTIVEIVVLLPNWFRNKALAARFMNNNINATVHFMMLEEHREMKFVTEAEKNKARKTLTDEYRKTMRKTFGSSWTKAKHAIPFGWDPLVLAMDGFVPDDAEIRSYRRPPSIPFRDLLIGVRKLPEGDHAGDLTRALYFAQQQTKDYVFPEDLPMILDLIGRTEITTAHTDRPIVRHYAALKDSVTKLLPEHIGSERLNIDKRITCINTEHPSRYNHEQMSLAVAMSQHTGRPLEGSLWGLYGQEHAAAVAQQSTQVLPSDIRAQVLTGIEHEASVPRLSPTIEAGAIPPRAVVDLLDIHPQKSVEEMDALMREYQNQVYMPVRPANLRYPPRKLLRECIEGENDFDETPLTKVARFAQQPDQLSTDWYVEDVPWLSQLLEVAQ